MMAVNDARSGTKNCQATGLRFRFIRNALRLRHLCGCGRLIRNKTLKIGVLLNEAPGETIDAICHIDIPFRFFVPALGVDNNSE
jgi:hypothetical protein